MLVRQPFFSDITRLPLTVLRLPWDMASIVHAQPKSCHDSAETRSSYLPTGVGNSSSYSSRRTGIPVYMVNRGLGIWPIRRQWVRLRPDLSPPGLLSGIRICSTRNPSRTLPIRD